LKDVLREYEGQEAHTVHLVFTPKSGARSQYGNQNISKTSTSEAPSNMSTSELRQRHPGVSSTSSSANQEQQQQQQQTNIPNNYYNAFYGASTSTDANSILAQQYAMQSWMQHAYAQYMNQYANL
jgi:hypothetical protein